MNPRQTPTAAERRLLLALAVAGTIMILFAAYGLASVAWKLTGGSPAAILIPALAAVALAAWVAGRFRRVRKG